MASIWAEMNYVPPRGLCNFKSGIMAPKCACLRFMIHPSKLASSFSCDGCSHHASFHDLENKHDDEVVARWRREECERRKTHETQQHQHQQLQYREQPNFPRALEDGIREPPLSGREIRTGYEREPIEQSRSSTSGANCAHQTSSQSHARPLMMPSQASNGLATGHQSRPQNSQPRNGRPDGPHFSIPTPDRASFSGQTARFHHGDEEDVLEILSISPSSPRFQIKAEGISQLCSTQNGDETTGFTTDNAVSTSNPTTFPTPQSTTSTSANGVVKPPARRRRVRPRSSSSEGESDTEASQVGRSGGRVTRARKASSQTTLPVNAPAPRTTGRRRTSGWNLIR